MSRCKSCCAPIRWARTAAGKPIPLDLEPVPGGNIQLRDGVARVLTPIEAMIEPLEGGPRFLSHFATCPYADEHRKARSGDS